MNVDVITDTETSVLLNMIRSQNRAKSRILNSPSAREYSVSPEANVPIVTSNDSFVEVFKSCKSEEIATNIESTKTKNNDLWSDEDISPLSNKLNADVRENGTMMNGSKNSNVLNGDPANNLQESKKTDVSSLLKDNDILFCPICLKPNHFDQSSGFVVHLKNCASKNKVSTDQVIKAIELQDKQTTERIALGLPVIKKEKSNIRRNAIRKGPMDSNLELAIALSTSLRESEMLSKLRVSETLLEAGLEQEAMSQCRQLENFGFMSTKLPEVQAQKGARSKNNRITILFNRSQEERERIITEKIAMILVDSDSKPQSYDVFAGSYFHVLKSNYLLNLCNEPTTLWRKSYQMDELTNEECYYVENLSRFVSPCKTEVGAKLKHVSQIPCRPPSPEKENESSDLKMLAALFEPKHKTVSQNLFKKFGEVDKSGCSIDTKMATDWKCLINEKFMSDLTIFAKNEKSIYAHKLVFHARCRSILLETIKEEENGKCSEMLMWLEYCYEGIIAFLEFIYTGRIPKTEKLNEYQVKDLKSICARYGFIELKDSIERQTAKDEMFEPGETSESETSYQKTSCEKFLHPHNRGSHSTLTKENKDVFIEEEMRIIKCSADLSSPEMFDKEKLLSPDPSEGKLHHEILSEIESIKDEMDVFDSSVNRSFTPEKNLENEDNPSVLENSSEKSASKEESVASNGSRTIIDDILSDLCGSPIKKSDSEEYLEEDDDFKSNENALFGNFKDLEKYGLSQTVLDDCLQYKDVNEDVICLSSSDDQQNDIFTQDEMEAAQLSSKIRSETMTQYFKRKSYSPFEKCPSKRIKRNSYSCNEEAKSSNDELMEEKPKRTRVARKVKKRKMPLSQTMSLSASDSDASLYKLDMVSSNYCDDSFRNDAEKEDCKVEQVNSQDSKSYGLPFRIGDFQDLTLDEQTENNLLRENKKDDVLKVNNDTPPKDIPSNESPYVSPVWDGFEYANDEYYGIEFSSEPPYSNNFPTSLTATSSPNVRSRGSSLSNVKRKESSTSAGHRESIKDPSFGSFSVDESLLNRIETDYLAEKGKTQEVDVTKITDVRRMKRRSKSDASVITKSRKCEDVTPCPDYANLSSPKLKKALDKYGIKTGLKRSKAVKLLKYIYEQLHPNDDEPESRTQVEKGKNTVQKRQKKNSPLTKQPNKPTYEISSDSDSMGNSDPFDVVLEESIMEDEGDDCMSDEDVNVASKSVTIDAAFRDILKEDPAFHTHILLYEPIWIEPLKQRLKEKGVKCSMNSLKDYLDEKCITFRTKRQWVSRRKKRRQNKNSQSQSNQN